MWPPFVELYGDLQDHEGCVMYKKLLLYWGFWLSEKQAHHQKFLTEDTVVPVISLAQDDILVFFQVKSRNELYLWINV